MKNKEFSLIVRICKKCNYEWFPRVVTPRRCPNCQDKLKEKSEVDADSQSKTI